MNLAAIREKLSLLEGEELIAAKELLTAIGISPEALEPKVQKPRNNFTSKLTPYYEKIDLTCVTCGNQYSKYFHFKEVIHNGQYLLIAATISSSQWGVEEKLETKFRKSVQSFCLHCQDNLTQWSKEELVSTLLHIQRGGQYKRVARKEG